ncbi:MAG: hypothetical protein HQK83_12945 [Fibrobacteria bacterium]|nr:hypothetical protein [Fibrobacteria bacterium]
MIKKLGCSIILAFGFIVLAGHNTFGGIRGPEHRTLRPLAMGNAFVALVDDKDALHYNPAGLNLMGSLGNKKRRPEMGYYPSDYVDMHMNFLGAGIPFGTAMNLLNIYQDHETALQGGLEGLQDDTTLVSDLVVFDREPILFALLTGGELAFHNFGMSYWGDVRVAPFLDVGVVLPQAGLELIQVDVCGEIGISRSFFRDRLAIGVEYRMAVREQIKNVQIGVGDIAEINTIIQDTIDNHAKGLTDFGRIGHGMDIGFLWQQTRSIRLGGAIQNLFMTLNHQKVTPKLTLGVACSPRVLQNNFRWKRKINFALDVEDVLNDENGYKFLSKVNMGAEWEQVLIPYILKGRLSVGAKGGYLTAGLGGNLFTVLHYEFATWAEEGGYYTGQKEDRYYVMNFGIGF